MWVGYKFIFLQGYACIGMIVVEMSQNVFFCLLESVKENECFNDKHVLKRYICVCIGSGREYRA